MSSDVQLSNFGISTGDLDKSVRFYTEGLGFEVVGGWKFGDMFAAACEVTPPMRARSTLLAKGETRLQLMEWTAPEPAPREPTPRNVVGLTHMAFTVNDLAAVVERLVALGGTVLEQTRTRIPLPGGAMEIVCVADPNGVRVELAEQPKQ